MTAFFLPILIVLVLILLPILLAILVPIVGCARLRDVGAAARGLPGRRGVITSRNAGGR
jgi:hypothetical protein